MGRVIGWQTQGFETHMRDLLSARKVETLKKPGRYCDGGGLWLQISQWNTKSWIFQYTSPTAPKRKKHGREVGRIRHLGLGPYGKHDVTLEKARILAGAAREQVRNGIDPVDVKRSYRFEQGFTFELNLWGDSDELRQAFVDKREAELD